MPGPSSSSGIGGGKKFELHRGWTTAYEFSIFRRSREREKRARSQGLFEYLSTMRSKRGEKRSFPLTAFPRSGNQTHISGTTGIKSRAFTGGFGVK